MDRGVKFYKARLRETGFLTRVAELYGTKFHEIKLQTPNSELKMKFGEAEFCDVKFHKARLRRAKFYGAEFAAKSEKFCGMKRRGAGA